MIQMTQLINHRQKRARTEGQKAAKTGGEKAATASKLLKQVKSVRPKQLTAKQRLARLKQKFSPAELSIESAHNPNPVSQNVNDDNNKSDDPQLKLENAEPTGKDPSFGSYDHLFDYSNFELLNSETKPNEPVIVENSSGSCSTTSGSQNATLDAVLQLKDMMTEIVTNLTLVRKQICRLEMKSMGAGAAVVPGNPIDVEILLDLDAALAKEGLPIKTCVELNDFEKKLRRDTNYRAKLVSLFYNCSWFFFTMIFAYFI